MSKTAVSRINPPTAITPKSTTGSPNQIGPGALDSGTGTFVLDVPGWLDVQCYVHCGMHLPTDATTMRAQLPADPPGGMDQFADLIAAYKTLHDHCQYWNDHTLQDAVSCASDIVHYNEKVPAYYGALTTLLPKLELTPPDPTAVAQFQAIITNLLSQAQGYADHAESVHQGMKTFADQTAQDQLTVRPLSDKYTKALSAQSPIIQQLSAQLAQDKSDLSDAQDEYNHDVIVAATAASYAWIWPAGTIAAGVVAGVYGKKATDALARVHGLQAVIGTISDELQAAAILLLDLTSIQSDLGDISGKLAAALPVLQTMQGAWTSIASDMQNILTVINQDISQAPAIIKSLGIDQAIAAWGAVAHEADVYRNTAFISVTQSPSVAKASGLALSQSLKRLALRSAKAKPRAAAAAA